MPTYEYKCEACGHRFELFQSITAGHVRRCPKCGKLKVRRLLSTGTGVIFKGSGFYATDYRSSAYNEAAKSDSAAGSPPPAKDGAKDATKDSTKDAAKPSEPAADKPAKSESKTPSKKPKPPAKES
jgi:putative FmdB family regulatory protein